MKRLLIALTLVALSASADKTAAFGWKGTVATVSVGSVVDVRNSTLLAYRYHQINWAPASGILTCTVKLEKSSDGATGWTDLIAAQSCTTAGSSSYTNDNTANFVRVNVTAISGASVDLSYYWDTQPSATDAANNATRVNCVTGCSAAATFTDNAAFTAGTTTVTNIGAVFNDGLAAVTSGNAAAPRITSSRAIHFNPRNNAGTEIGTSATPIRIDPTGTTAQPATQSGTWTMQPGNTANTTPWLTTINQGGNSASVNASGQLVVNCAAGCAAAGDTTTGATALGALNATITLALAGERGATFQLQSGGTGVYTVTPQCSFDGGTIYNANGYIQDPFTGVVSTTAGVASGQATTDYPVMCPQGSSHVQMKVTAYTSGTANFLARSTVVTWPDLVWGIVTTGAPTYTTGQINGLSLDTSGNLRTLIGAALPTGANVIGGVTQSGTWTVQPGNTANTTPWLATISQGGNSATVSVGGALKVDGSAVTQPISGTVTANQGAPPWQIVGSVASGAADSGNPLKDGGVFNTTQPTVTTGQRVDAQMTARGALIVGTGVDTFNVTVNAALPVGTNVIGALSANQSVNLAQVGGSAAVTGGVAGTLGTGGLAASGAAKAGNPNQVGGVFNTTQPTVTTGQAVEAQYTARGGAIVATGADTFNVTVSTALPTGANVIGALSANQSVNVAQINGVIPLMGNGVTGTGSQRVTIASDNTAFAVNATLSAETTKIIGTVRTLGNAGGIMDAAGQNAASPANELLVAGQFNTTPTTITTGNISPLQLDSAGNLLVKVNVALPTGANVIGALSANQSVNEAQVGGTTILTGNGVTGAGSERVTVASDNSNAPGIGGSATASAVPSAARYVGGNGSGNLTGITVCDTQQRINITADTQMITGTAAKHIYICHIDVVVSAADNVAVVSGTGSVCATGIAGVFGGTTAATGWNFAANGGIGIGGGLGWVGRTVATGDNICILRSSAAQVSGNIVYTVY